MSTKLNPEQIQSLFGGQPPRPQPPAPKQIGKPGSRGPFATQIQVILVDQGGHRAFYSLSSELLGEVPFETPTPEQSAE
jgi:hypothetical protein